MKKLPILINKEDLKEDKEIQVFLKKCWSYIQGPKGELYGAWNKFQWNMPDILRIFLGLSKQLNNKDPDKEKIFSIKNRNLGKQVWETTIKNNT